jgi:hypothetical protein
MSSSTQRLIVEECLKSQWVAYYPYFKPSLLTDSVAVLVVAAAASIRQTAELAASLGRCPCKTGPNDRPHRVGAELAGEHHTPDEQRPSFSFLS